MPTITGSCHCGAAKWSFEGNPGTITACNCNLCHRYGGLWAYDFEGERIRVDGPTDAYVRWDEPEPTLEIRFCPICAAVVYWRGLAPDPDGRRRLAVNVRLAPLDAVADLPIRHFDGRESFAELPRDDRCVRDLWF